MTPENHRANIDLLRRVFDGAVGYVEREHPVYGTIFECLFTPCCIPLGVIAWVNPDNQGFFVRIGFPSVPVDDRAATLGGLNDINWRIPIGSFVLSEAGEVRFKSALFVGDAIAVPRMIGEFFASADDMVRTEYANVIAAVTGSIHEHLDA